VATQPQQSRSSRIARGAFHHAWIGSIGRDGMQVTRRIAVYGPVRRVVGQGQPARAHLCRLNRVFHASTIPRILIKSIRSVSQCHTSSSLFVFFDAFSECLESQILLKIEMIPAEGVRIMPNESLSYSTVALSLFRLCASHNSLRQGFQLPFEYQFPLHGLIFPGRAPNC